jgi:hypothetical protein
MLPRWYAETYNCLVVPLDLVNQLESSVRSDTIIHDDGTRSSDMTRFKIYLANNNLLRQ